MKKIIFVIICFCFSSCRLQGETNKPENTKTVSKYGVEWKKEENGFPTVTVHPSNESRVKANESNIIKIEFTQDGKFKIANSIQIKTNGVCEIALINKSTENLQIPLPDCSHTFFLIAGITSNNIGCGFCTSATLLPEAIYFWNTDFRFQEQIFFQTTDIRNRTFANLKKGIYEAQIGFQGRTVVGVFELVYNPVDEKFLNENKDLSFNQRCEQL